MRFFIKSIFLIILLLTCTFGCGRAQQEEQGIVLQIDDLPKDIKIPKTIVNELAAEDISFMPINVYLSEKNKSVLKDRKIQIKLPRGGGVIDFATLMGFKTGTYYIKFVVPELEDVEGLRVWHLSQARARNVSGERWGSGCHKAYEITKAFHKMNTSDGLKLNSTRELHLTVVGGHFVFAYKKGLQHFMTQVTFLNSQKPEYFCEGFL
jgi:hypothetical protein